MHIIKIKNFNSDVFKKDESLKNKKKGDMLDKFLT